jgi:hypothetical protein
VAQGVDPEFKPSYCKKEKKSIKTPQISEAYRGILGTILHS